MNLHTNTHTLLLSLSLSPGATGGDEQARWYRRATPGTQAVTEAVKTPGATPSEFIFCFSVGIRV